MDSDQTGDPAVPTFDRIGGAVTIDRLVEAFYAYMDTMPEARTIRAMHAEDLGPVKDVLKRYLTEWTGGPPLYSVERGHPRLRRRHMGFPIDTAARDAWLTCMRAALDDTVSVVDEREKMFALMAKLADWMRNTGDNPHDNGEVIR